MKVKCFHLIVTRNLNERAISLEIGLFYLKKSDDEDFFSLQITKRPEQHWQKRASERRETAPLIEKLSN